MSTDFRADGRTMGPSLEDERKRIKHMIVHVGDETRKIAGNIRGLCGVLQDDMDEHRELILSTVVECFKYLPVKSGVYGTFLAFMNDSSRLFVHDAIISMCDEFEIAVKTGDMSVSRQLLRGFVELANSRAVKATSVISMLRLLASLGSDCAVFLTATTLPFIGKKVSEVFSEDISAIFVECENHVKHRKSVDDFQKTIDSIRQLLVEPANLVRPYEMEGLVDKIDLFPEEQLLVIPGLSDSAVSSIKSRTFILVPPTATEPNDWILKDLLVRTIHAFSAHVGECGRQLIRVFGEEPARADLLVEILMSGIFASVSSHLPIFYFRLASVLGSMSPAFKSLWEAELIKSINSAPSSSRDAELILAEGIAWQVTQEKYQFPYTALDLTNPASVEIAKIAFGDAFLRLSFHQNLKHRLPSFLYDMLPATPPGPVEDDSEVNSDVFRGFREAVKVRDGTPEMVASLVGNDEARFRIFVRALLHNGSKTPTHLGKLVSVYASVLRGWEGWEGEPVVLEEVGRFWEKYPQRLEETIASLLRNQVVGLEAVVRRFGVAGGNEIPPTRRNISGRNFGELYMEIALESGMGVKQVADLLIAEWGESEAIRSIRRISLATGIKHELEAAGGAVAKLVGL